MRKRSLQLVHRRHVLAERRRRLGVELDLDEPALTEAPAAGVARDRVEPRARRLGLGAALHRGIGVQERDLSEVFRVLAIPGQAKHGPEDLGAMSADESLERLGQGGRLAAPPIGRHSS